MLHQGIGVAFTPLPWVGNDVEQAQQFIVADGQARGNTLPRRVKNQHRLLIHSQSLQTRLMFTDVLERRATHGADRLREAIGIDVRERQAAPDAKRGGERHAHDSGLTGEGITTGLQFGIQGKIGADGGNAQHHGQAMARIQRRTIRQPLVQRTCG
ncbi:hypothetical protein D3C71_1098330 [compost metagenome]